jgi:microcystin degradation protein MlrC
VRSRSNEMIQCSLYIEALGPSTFAKIDVVPDVMANGRSGTPDRALFRFVGIDPEKMKIIVEERSNHFWADFASVVEDGKQDIRIVKTPGTRAADPSDLPWRKSPETILRRP